MFKKIFILLLILGSFFVYSTSAYGHVHVDPATAEKGSAGVFEIAVPNESSNATTTNVRFVFPESYPIVGLKSSNENRSRWSESSTMSKKAINEIVFSGGEIPVNGEFEFGFEYDEMPSNTDELIIKVIQTYSDGEIVRWVDEELPDDEEPEHPAAVLKLTGAGKVQEATSTTEAEKVVKESESKDSKSDNSKLPVYVVLAIAALIVAALGIRFFKNTK